MKADQKFTPKYWVGHNKTTDDIIPSTLAKSLSTTEMLMENEFGDEYWENENYETILVEIKIIEDKDK